MKKRISWDNTHIISIKYFEIDLCKIQVALVCVIKKNKGESCNFN